MKRVLIALCALLTLAACTKEMNPLESVDKGPLQTIQVSVAPFGEQTKTAVSPQNQFTWSSGDQIGIYPVNSTLGAGQTSQQIVFKINGTGDASAATFTGTGWGLITSGTYKYFSYYPYSTETKYNEAPVEYKKNLNQATNDTTAATTTAHLGVNDYLYAPQIQPTDAASCNFAFKHLGVLVRFIITVPDTCSTRKFKSMEVVAEDSIFTVKGKYDPSSATSSSAPVITRLDSTSKLTLTFNGTTGFEPNSDKQIDAYFLIAPTAIKGKDFTVTVYDENGYAYTAAKTGSYDLNAGDYKKYNCTVKPGTGGVVNLSSKGTANCYIVPSSGRYKFLANIKGNGVEVTGGESADINLTGCMATVLWETENTKVAPDAGDIIKNVSIQENYVVFDATGKQGNALISVKDVAKDSIIWSWHIWSTSADLEGLKQEYPNVGGYMMDRNLGALTATPGNNLTTGFLYQWGRPFPLRGLVAINDTTGMATTGGSDLWVNKQKSSTTGTISYSAAHPTYNIGAEGTYTDWLVSSNPNLWNDDTKTMYDPCPVGWRIPKGGDKGVWSTAGFNKDSCVYSSHGRLFITISPNAYYPYAGFNYIGGLNKSCGLYWSTSTTGNNAYSFQIASSTVATYVSYGRAMGASIRPYQD